MHKQGVCISKHTIRKIYWFFVIILTANKIKRIILLVLQNTVLTFPIRGLILFLSRLSSLYIILPFPYGNWYSGSVGLVSGTVVGSISLPTPYGNLYFFRVIHFESFFLVSYFSHSGIDIVIIFKTFKIIILKLTFPIRELIKQKIPVRIVRAGIFCCAFY